MNSFKDFLAFRKLLTPHLLQIMFWGGIGGTLYGTYWLFTHDNWTWIMALVFGTIATRLIFESLILRFRTYEGRTLISNNLDRIDRITIDAAIEFSSAE